MARVPVHSSRWLRAAALSVVVAFGATAEGSPYGVNAHIPSDYIADEIAAAGIQWVRIDVIWALMEPEQDRFDWQGYDALMDRLRSRGLRILANVGGTPAWATSGSEFSGVPDDPADWQDFCYRLASRYHHDVDAWALWNEPNLDHFWEGSRSQYLEWILLPGIEAVRTVDPDAMMVGPDLAHLQSGDWDDWLDNVVHRVRNLLDVVTHHVYPSDGTSGDVADKLNDGGPFPWDPPSVRSVLADAGWHRRPVWLTETGVQSDEYGEPGQEAFYVGVLGTWFGRDNSDNLLDRVFFYEMADPGTDLGLSWGVLDAPPDHRRKPAFYAYADFIDTAVVDDAEIELTGVPPIMGSRESADIQVEVRNTGTSTWRADDGYVVTLEVDQLGWITSIDPIAESNPVEPGASAILTGRIISPPIGPGYPLVEAAVSVRIERIGDARFGDVARAIVISSVYDLPEIVVQPTAAAAPFNGSAQFSVTVTSDSELEYQWRRHTVDLEDDHRFSGAAGPVLTISGIGYGDVGDYDCVITNAIGRVVTATVPLSIDGAPLRRPTGRVGGDPTATLVRWLEFRTAPRRADAESRGRRAPPPGSSRR